MNSKYKGKNLTLTVYGGSHEPKIGFILEGFPKDVKIDKDLLDKDIQRRKPTKEYETKRREDDKYEVISGLDDNFNTTEDPIEISFENKDFNPEDYQQFKDIPRPGSIDFVAVNKYGDEIEMGGSSIFSGRMTLPMVAAGSICKNLLDYKITTTIVQIGKHTKKHKIKKYLKRLNKKKDSTGGIVEVTVDRPDIGIGEPLFGKLNSKLASIIFSIPGVKGLEFGAGFKGVEMTGSEFNDQYINKDGQTITNNNGGINGGISNGNDISFKVFFRPPSSIGKVQNTFNIKKGQMDRLEIKGRHDVCYIERVLVVLENLTAFALLDEVLDGKVDWC